MAQIKLGRQSARDSKLAELILLIASRSEDDTKFGAVKLNKLLFHCDFSAYLTFGRSITDQEYFRLPNGPAPRHYKPVEDRMRLRSELAIKVTNYHGYRQHKPIALRRPNLSSFTSQEVALVDEIVQRFKNQNATEISNDSHLFVGWRLAANKETIPYQTALVGFRKPTDKEREAGKKLEGLAVGCLTRAH